MAATVGGIKAGGAFVELGARDAGLRKVLAGASASLKSFTAGLGAAGLATGGLGALRDLAASTVGAAAGLEDLTINLAKATDLDGEPLAALAADLKGLSTTLAGIKLDALFQIATQAGKLGVAKEDLLGFTRGVAELSIAMDDIPAEEIANQLGKTNAAFRLSTDDLLGLGSAIDKVADSGASSAADILDVTQRLAGSANAAGLTAQETVALAGALLDTGTRAELAGTSLTKLALALSNAEGQAGFARTLGITAEEFADKVRESPIQALQEWLDALRQLDSGGQQAAISESLGRDSAVLTAEIQKLAGQTDVLDKHLASANREMETHAQIQSSVAKKSGAASAAFVQFQNKAQIAAATLGEALRPAVESALEKMSEFLEVATAIAKILPEAFAAARAEVDKLKVAIERVFGKGAVEALKQFAGLRGQEAIGGGGIAAGLARGRDLAASPEKAAQIQAEQARAKVEADRVAGQEQADLLKRGALGAGGEMAAAARAPAFRAVGDALGNAGLRAVTLGNEVVKLTESLQEQADTFGMSSREADIYRLKLQGATDAELAAARALDERLKGLEAEKEQQDELNASAKSTADRIKDALETPAEKLQKEFDAIREAQSQGLLTAGEAEAGRFLAFQDLAEQGLNQATRQVEVAGSFSAAEAGAQGFGSNLDRQTQESVKQTGLLQRIARVFDRAGPPVLQEP